MSGRCREALLYVRELLGDPPSCPGVVGGPPRCPGVVGSPSRKFGRTARRSGNGRDTLSDVPEGWEVLPDVWEALPVFREWSGGPLRCPGEDGRLTRMFGSGRETLPNVSE